MTSLHMGKWSRWLVAAIVAVAGGILSVFIMGWDCLLLPQAPAAARPLDLDQIRLRTETDGSRWLGGSCRGERDGVRYGLVAGPPEWRGLVLADLMTPEMQQARAASLQASRPWFLNPDWKAASRRYYPWKFGQMLPVLPEESRGELAGLTARLHHRSRDQGDFYSWLAYQAAPESSGRAWAFGASGLLIQQVEAGPFSAALDQVKMVTLVKPVAGLSYLAVGPPGLVGVMAAMNDAGIGIVVVPGPGQARNPRAVPASLLARQVMIQSCSLEEAAQTLQAASVFAPVTFLLASGTERRVIAVEKTPEKTSVRSAESRGLTAVSLFQSQALAKEPATLRVREAGPDARRLLRLRELLEKNKDGLSLQQAAALLRDTKGAYGQVLGYGHPAALQSFRTSQSVIFDLTSKIVWVARAPSPMNTFVPFGFNGFPQAPKTAPLAEDQAWPEDRRRQYARYDRELREANRLLEAGHYQECLAVIQEAHPWNPDDYRPYLISGKALLGLKRWDEAAYNFNAARQHHPAFPTERAFIENQMKRLQGKR